jgi:hypothetical protein
MPLAKNIIWRASEQAVSGVLPLIDPWIGGLEFESALAGIELALTRGTADRNPD